MNAEIITIGDELLIGQVVDTNSAWIGKILNAAGITIRRINSVSDKASEILDALESSMQRVELVLITGGLGPTRDDITKNTLADFFGSPLVLNHEALENLKAIFTRLNRPLHEINLRQAEVPESCTVLQNRNGTAPGMWFEKNEKIIVSMPGVPFEMKAMVEFQVIPMLKSRFELPALFHYTLLTAGIGESFLAELLSTFEDELPAHIKLAYLPALGLVRLRLSAHGARQELLRQEVMAEAAKIRALAGRYIVIEEDIPLHEAILRKLQSRGKTLSLAESCTGGYISHQLTTVPGSSATLMAGIVAYSNTAKINFLGVKAETIAQFGAVSQEVARQMVTGLLERTGTDFGISVTGIAGPDGGTEDKPVGTVWIGVAHQSLIYTRRFQFGNQRFQNIERSANHALTLLNNLIEHPEDFKQ